MLKFRNFLIRWCYRIAMFFIVIFTIALLTVNDVGIGWKIFVVIIDLLLWTIPEYFPEIFKKAPKKPMSGLEFEHHCADLLVKKGFKKVTVTPPSSDYGADLVAYDKQGSKWVFQCKYYSGNVGNSAVQEVVAAKAHYKADKAAVMTNSRLTSKAKELATENDVLLYEGIH